MSTEDISLEEGLLAGQDDPVEQDLPSKEATLPPIAEEGSS